MSDQRIIWIASFPKSGNTWIRILLAYYFLPKEAGLDINSIHKFTLSDMRKDFFERANGGPFEKLDLDEWLALRSKVIPLIARSKPDHHFVKTHCALSQLNGVPLIPPSCTAGALYLIRNPFDLALSYARHLTVDVDVAIDRMCAPENTNGSLQGIREPIGRWDDHVTSWAQATGLYLKLFRYEDLLSDTEAQAKQMLGFLRVPIDLGKLRWAIRKASFKSLQKQEAELGFRERPQKMDRFFVSGQAGTWRTDLTADQIDRISEAFRDMIGSYYPELAAEISG